MEINKGQVHFHKFHNDSQLHTWWNNTVHSIPMKSTGDVGIFSAEVHTIYYQSIKNMPSC